MMRPHLELVQGYIMPATVQQAFRFRTAWSRKFLEDFAGGAISD